MTDFGRLREIVLEALAEIGEPTTPLDVHAIAIWRLGPDYARDSIAWALRRLIARGEVIVTANWGLRLPTEIPDEALRGEDVDNEETR